VFETILLAKILGPKRKYKEDGEKYVMGDGIICISAQYYYYEQTREDFIGKDCSRHAKGKNCMQNFDSKC
jgi:hypothetical protein